MHEQGAPLEQDPVEPSARLVLSRRLRYILNARTGSMNCGAAPRKLAVSAALAGEVSGAFVPAEPFTYLNHHA